MVDSVKRDISKTGMYNIVSIVSLLLVTSCSSTGQYYTNNNRAQSYIKVNKVDMENNYSIDYVFYINDENVDVILKETEQEKQQGEDINHTTNRQKFTEELASKEENLRIKLDEEYDNKLNKAVSMVTSSYIDAQSFFYKKKYNEALKAIQITLSYAPESAVVLSLAGSIYYAAGHLEKSVDYWKKALKNNPNLTQVRSMLRKAQQSNQPKYR